MQWSLISIRVPGFKAGTNCRKILMANSSGQSCNTFRKKYTAAPSTVCGSKKSATTGVTMPRNGSGTAAHACSTTFATSWTMMCFSAGNRCASAIAKLPSPPPISTTTASGLSAPQSNTSRAAAGCQPGMRCMRLIEDAKRRDRAGSFASESQNVPVVPVAMLCPV